MTTYIEFLEYINITYKGNIAFDSNSNSSTVYSFNLIVATLLAGYQLNVILELLLPTQRLV
jgi:hypothetical protein